jgi:hypothetical protein
MLGYRREDRIDLSRPRLGDRKGIDDRATGELPRLQQARRPARCGVTWRKMLALRFPGNS